MTVRHPTQLRDFQARLTERLRLAGSAPDLAARLGLMIGDGRYLVDLSEAGEIVPMPESIVPVPLTREWLLGLVNLRGMLFTVIDLQRYANQGHADLGKESRLLALAARLNFNAAIVVTRMLGLRNIGSMRVAEDAGDDVAADGRARHDWIGCTFVDAEGNRWRELSLARLAASDRFLMVGR
jgi:twitching motility protein PilI